MCGLSGLRHNNFTGALELMRRATAAPSVEVRRRVASACDKEAEPVQLQLHKSSKLWSLYVDLEESLGTLESTREAYERMLDLKIATPQIILNYAQLLEENSYFEDLQASSRERHLGDVSVKVCPEIREYKDGADERAV